MERNETLDSQRLTVALRALGNCTVNGEALEFCDVRIFAKAPPEKEDS